jgi:hypothetical protein
MTCPVEVHQFKEEWIACIKGLELIELPGKFIQAKKVDDLKHTLLLGNKVAGSLHYPQGRFLLPSLPSLLLCGPGQKKQAGYPCSQQQDKGDTKDKQQLPA